MPVEEDATLIDKSRAGDRAAFSAFVRRHEGAVRRYVRSLVDSDADADDAVQDAFVQVWRALQRPEAAQRGDGSTKAWLYTIARHAAYRRGRRRVGEPARHVAIDDVEESAGGLASLGVAAGWGKDPETLVAALESRERVQQALARLPAIDREVLLLRDVIGLSGPETASALSLSLAAEKSRIHRARLALMAALRDAPGGAP